MATGTISWTPAAFAAAAASATGRAAWRPLTGRLNSRVARAAWRPRTLPLPAPLPASIIVLARLEDFEVDAENRPIRWLPMSRGMFGTRWATLQLAWGTVLSVHKAKRAPTGADMDDIGLILAGFVGDQTDTLTVHCDVSMMEPEMEPETGDIFEINGAAYCIYEVDIINDVDGQAEMTVTGIRWKGCTLSHAPAGLTPPKEWT